jgi:hypothetical protein
MIRCKNLDKNNKIESLDQWFVKCPPQGKLKHWKEGRSAKETAKHWLHTIPEQFKKILNQSNLIFTLCSPEYVSKLDSYKGNARNHDLLIIAEGANKETVVISIESKADESFDVTISERIKAATTKFIKKPKSKALDRIKDLRNAIFGSLNDDQLPLRYQILTAIAGTLAEAKNQKATKAYFLVQTFVSDEINQKKHLQNQADLDAFICLLTHGNSTKIEEGKLVGPTWVHGNEFIPDNIELWIGKYSIEI